MTLIAGWLVDRSGCRFVMILSMILFTLGESIAAGISGFPPFLLGRVLAGAGSAGTSLALTAYVGLHVPYERRGQILGWIGTAYFAGVSLGPLAVTQIAGRTSLPVLLAVLAVLGGGGVIHASMSLEPDPPKKHGTGWSGCGPVLRNRGFWGIVIAQVFFSAGVISMVQFFGDWLKTSYGLDAQTRGFLFALGGLPSLVGAPAGGMICDRWGKKPFLIAATLALSVLVCVMPYLRSSLTAVGVLFGLVGFAAAARYSALHALTTRLTGEELLGRLVAMRNFLTHASTALGLLLMGHLYATFPQSGYTLMGWLTTLLLLLSIPLLARWIPPEEPDRHRQDRPDGR
jgi:predicted MFS family arabinose efflux permease